MRAEQLISYAVDDGRFKVVHYEAGDWERTLAALAS
jgi:hypothetical protein